MSKEAKAFDYCKSPDGHDMLQKFGVLFKPTALTAFAVSTIDVILYSHPKGYLQTLARYIHFSAPIFGATFAFVAGSNVAGSLRRKDDKLNWFIGGASSGAVVGVWRKSVMGGFVAAVALGLLAVGKKHCIQNDYDMFIPRDLTFQYGGLRSVRQDWTLMKHRPGNWTTGSDQ
ncbi:Tim17 domain containing protein [Asbolus verrucosus]|uniref:NADH dehydrogenase [ubiquinone] 1 alpha subcomplex subunit 11 n=1 Tax=Asbolus verrucosus TaxID=1661398 RepID=A0A482VX06_ASBVE|nr:Tim17 domain containing protein [Asbolus verrucosus]